MFDTPIRNISNIRRGKKLISREKTDYLGLQKILEELPEGRRLTIKGAEDLQPEQTREVVQLYVEKNFNPTPMNYCRATHSRYVGNNGNENHYLDVEKGEFLARQNGQKRKGPASSKVTIEYHVQTTPAILN